MFKRALLSLVLAAVPASALNLKQLQRESRMWQHRLGYDGWRVFLSTAGHNKMPDEVEGLSMAMITDHVEVIVILDESAYTLANGWTGTVAQRDADQRDTVLHEWVHLLLKRNGQDTPGDAKATEDTVNQTTEMIEMSYRKPAKKTSKPVEIKTS